MKLSKEGANFSNNYINNNKKTNNNADKSKLWTRIKNIVNDGVVDIHNVKSKQSVLNLSSNTPTDNQGNNNTKPTPTPY